jgi:predicted metal-dependent phosphoesterase TrpH
MKADLHVHTSNTDCSHSPVAVFEMAKSMGVTAIAITDHDTLYGIQENKGTASKCGIEYIPGIEISAYDYENDVPCHIVGLYVKPGYKPLEDMISAVTKKRHEHSALQIQKLNDMGYKLKHEDFIGKSGIHGIYKQHIMHVLLEKGYTRQMFGSFYSRMFKKGGPLYMQINYPRHKDAVRVLAESGAFPILAHPTLYGNVSQVRKLMDNGLKGMEAWYPSASKSQTAELIKLCEENKLFPSAGSDYHGYYSKELNGYVGSHFVTNLDMVKHHMKVVA